MTITAAVTVGLCSIANLTAVDMAYGLRQTDVWFSIECTRVSVQNPAWVCLHEANNSLETVLTSTHDVMLQAQYIEDLDNRYIRMLDFTYNRQCHSD